MHALMAEEFRREAEQEDDPEGAVDNGGSDANTDCDGNDSDANNTDEELRTANEFHWPLDMLQEQFRILQSRIVDEVRRAIREEFDEMRSGVSKDDLCVIDVSTGDLPSATRRGVLFREGVQRGSPFVSNYLSGSTSQARALWVPGI